jgi:hypothetical protein
MNLSYFAAKTKVSNFEVTKFRQRPHRAPQTSLGWKETWKMARGYTTHIPH